MTDQPAPVQPSTAKTPSSDTMTPYNHEALTAKPLAQNQKKSPLLTIGIPLFVVLLLAVGAYFLVSKINTPLKVKEKVELVEPTFDSFSRNVSNIIEHIDREPKVDADSIERYALEGENLLQDARKDKELLDTALGSVNLAELSVYKGHIEGYMQKADEVITLEDENVKLGRAVASYIKEYQQQAAQIQSASAFVYSDPDKFIQTMNTLTVEMEKFVGELQKVELKSEMKDPFADFVKLQNIELQYLKEMKTAIDNRSQPQVVTATNKYAAEKKNAEEDYNRSSDALDKKLRDLTDDLEKLAQNVTTEHQSLRNKYSF